MRESKRDERHCERTKANTSVSFSFRVSASFHSLLFKHLIFAPEHASLFAVLREANSTIETDLNGFEITDDNRPGDFHRGDTHCSTRTASTTWEDPCRTYGWTMAGLLPNISQHESGFGAYQFGGIDAGDTSFDLILLGIIRFSCA
jgi:hypothetical protein